MKTSFLFCILSVLMLLPAHCPSQNLTAGDTSVIRKGIIRFKDGTSVYFRNLRCRNDSVLYFDQGIYLRESALSEINTISKRSSYAGLGALTGIPAGLLLGAAVAKGIRNNTNFWVTVLSLGTVTNVDTKKQETNGFIITTLLVTGIGILTGSLIKKEKVIFPKSIASVSFQPEVLPLVPNTPGIGLTCRINIR
jgi:hypothetical protein